MSKVDGVIIQPVKTLTLQSGTGQTADVQRPCDLHGTNMIITQTMMGRDYVDVSWKCEIAGCEYVVRYEVPHETAFPNTFPKETLMSETLSFGRRAPMHTLWPC